MFIFILLLCLIILIIIMKRVVNYRTKQVCENFIDKYNIEEDDYDKQYVDICNIIENDKNKIEKDVKKILEKISDKKICIFGCGTGHYTNEFLKNKCIVVGVDKSRNMLEKATIENTKCEFIRGNIKKKTLFKENELNNIFIDKNVLNLNEYSNIVDIIRNIGKWVKKDGNVIVNIYNNNKLDKIYPRQYSQSFKNNNSDNDGIKNVTFTYFKNFRYDTWIKKISKNKYDWFEKIVLENNNYRIKKQNLTILPKKNIINLFINNNFIVKTIIKNRDSYLQNDLIVFSKK